MASVVTVEGWPQRGAPTLKDQQELSERVGPLSAMLEWSVEPFRIEASEGDGSLWIVTQVGEGEAGWRDLCQCLALGRRLSRFRPGWRWQLTDDTRLMEQRFNVCELGMKDGRIQRLAGWAAVDDGDLQSEIDAALEKALGERLRWIRRGEAPEQRVETEAWFDPNSNTIEVVEPHTLDPEADEPTEQNRPTIIEMDNDSDANLSLEFIEPDGPAPQTILHKPAQSIRTSNPIDESQVQPHGTETPVDVDSNPGSIAAEGMELLGAIQKLRGLIQHHDPVVRRDAVEAVAAMAGPAISLILRPMLADPDEEVRKAARRALLAIKG